LTRSRKRKGGSKEEGRFQETELTVTGPMAELQCTTRVGDKKVKMSRVATVHPTVLKLGVF
jgi:hypothetical protein